MNFTDLYFETLFFNLKLFIWIMIFCFVSLALILIIYIIKDYFKKKR